MAPAFCSSGLIAALMLALPLVQAAALAPLALSAPSRDTHGLLLGRGSSSSSDGYPTAFDSSLGNNFTQTSCPTFFNQFLQNPDFVSCHPVSLMLQTSNSFFQASKSLVLLTRALDAACTVDVSACSTLMSSYATQLRTQCDNDYSLGNPLVTMAYEGFLSYAPMYAATCLRDQSVAANGTTRSIGNATSTSTASSTSATASATATSTVGGYCFANAMTNTSNPTGVYMYYLPLGVPLPGGSDIECSYCTQQTMDGFATYAGNVSQPLHSTYSGAAVQVNERCGPNFAQTSVNNTSGATSLLNSGWVPSTIASAIAILWLL